MDKEFAVIIRGEQGRLRGVHRKNGKIYGYFKARRSDSLTKICLVGPWGSIATPLNKKVEKKLKQKIGLLKIKNKTSFKKNKINEYC